MAAAGLGGYTDTMALDLTFYDFKVAEEKAFAVRKVEVILEAYSNICAAANGVAADHEISVNDVSREVLDRLHYTIGAMLYSSGYWFKVDVKKIRKTYYIHITVQKMTEKEKAGTGFGAMD